MNNLRFLKTGKRKLRVNISSNNMGDATGDYMFSDLISQIPLVGQNTHIASFKVKRIEFEIVDSNVTNEVADFTVLGRSVEVVSSNSVGVDGVYKIPEQSILGLSHQIDTNIDFALFGKGSFASMNEALDAVAIYVYVDYVE